MEFETASYEGRRIQRPISPYHYRPLNTSDNEIRLVKLDIAGCSANRITGAIVQYPLHDVPAFVALSYEWGNPERYVTLRLDDINVPATINLGSALRQLLRHGCTRIWIDALCIDQQNGAERSAQILRMEAIYKKAHTVAVWLGLESDGSLNVMRFADNFGRTRLGSANVVHRIKPTHIRSIAMDVRAFFMRSYWSRVWIIQEIVAASRLRVLCGPDMVDWASFSIFVSALPDRLRAQERTIGLGDSDMARQISQFRRDRTDGGSMSMLQALHLSSLSNSTDRKDKVFALLGLSFDRLIFMAEPTYAWTERELCMSMTISFFESKRSLDIIFVASENHTSYPELPSWCPVYTRFSSAPDLQHIISYVSGQDHRHRIGVKCRRWNTTGTSDIGTGLVDRSNNLFVTAWPIGRIAALSRRNGAESHHYDNRLKLEALKPSDRRVSTSEALSRILFLLYNEDYERHKHDIDGLVGWWVSQRSVHVARADIFLSLLYNFDSDSLRHERLTNEFNSIRRWRHLQRSFLINGKSLSRRCPTYVDGQKMPNFTGDPMHNVSEVLIHALGFHETVDNLKSKMPTPDLKGSLSALSSVIDEKMRLMTTDRGDVGWAHHYSRIRDEIYLVSGCSMPVILRPAYREGIKVYKVVGHAYVDGFMDGKAWSKARSHDMVALQIC
jgi:hypothetical protein